MRTTARRLLEPPRIILNNDVTTTLDPAIDSGLSSATQLAFGFDQLVVGYAGPTATLRRSSDGATAAFGLTTKGLFDLASATGWANNSDLSVVSFTDQKGTGKLLVATGNIPLVTGGKVKRMGTTWDSTTGQLNLSNTKGAIGCVVSGGAYFEVATSGIVTTSGFEIHMLMSSLKRKVPANTAEPVGLGGDTTVETYWTYGVGTTNYINYEATGGNFTHKLRRNGLGASGTDQLPTISNPVIKANAQHITSARYDANEMCLYAFGKKLLTAVPGTGNITNLSSFGNGSLKVGARYTPATNSAGNILFGGIIVTNSLGTTDAANKSRLLLSARLTLQANQHLGMSTTALRGMFDELVLFKNLNASTGQVAGENGKLTFQFNLSTTQYTQTPNWSFNYSIPDIGLVGPYNPSETNYANTFKALNNYFADCYTGSMIVIGYRDLQAAPHLVEWFMDGTSDHTSAPPTNNSYATNFSKAVGEHHAQPNHMRRVARFTYDNGDSANGIPADVTGNEGWNDGAGGGSTTTPGTGSQSRFKYLFNSTADDWAFPSTSSTTASITNYAFGATSVPVGTVITPAYIASVTSIAPGTPECRNYPSAGLQFPMNSGFLSFSLATFEKPASYDPTASLLARWPYMRKATTQFFNAPLTGTTISHLDCSVVQELGNACVTHADPNAVLQSAAYEYNLQGTRLMFGFARRAFSLEEAQAIQVNAYKLIA